MSHYHSADFEEMEDEYDMNEPVDDMEGEDEYQELVIRDSDAEDEDDADQLHKLSDTSAADARSGKDIQGIPWETIEVTRETYRQARLEQYKNYENIPNSGVAAMMVQFVNQPKKAYQIEIMDVHGHVAPSEKHPGSLLEGFLHTQISTMAVKDNLLVAGGFQGELICKHLDREGISFCCRTTYDDNAITNALEIFNTSRQVISLAI
ncbi:hypothetical protein Zm00014a_032699 [Zea mays]|uniref:Transducin/WD40 repeat-like superfamily protein n=1 Tax=Zea mays TaxID=4577 RepID=A0A3L6DFK9_MAIZE|nr:hypothetical protein Zm00014a_032699 [Zea mays]